MAHVTVVDVNAYPRRNRWVNRVIATMLGNTKYSAVVDLLSRKAKERDIRRSPGSRTDAAIEDPGVSPSPRLVTTTRRVRGIKVKVAV